MSPLSDSGLVGSDLAGADLAKADLAAVDLAAAAAPPSFLFPSRAGQTTLTWIRAVTYTLDTPGPSTIHYSLDRSTPTPGTAGTSSGASPLVVSLPLYDHKLKWYADYGPAYPPEPLRTIEARVEVLNPSADFGSITERVSLNGRGPVAVVAPGETVPGSATYQAWRSRDFGTCPTCQLQYVIFLDPSTVATNGCVDMVNTYGPYPGRTQNLSFSVKAPTTPGQYTLRAGITLQAACNGVVPLTYYDIGLVVVR